MVSLNVPVMVEAVREYDSGVTVRPGVHVRLQVLPDLVVAVQLSVCDMVETVSDMLADCVCVRETVIEGKDVGLAETDPVLDTLVRVALPLRDTLDPLAVPVTDCDDSVGVLINVTDLVTVIESEMVELDDCVLIVELSV